MSALLTEPTAEHRADAPRGFKPALISPGRRGWLLPLIRKTWESLRIVSMEAGRLRIDLRRLDTVTIAILSAAAIAW